MSAANYLRNVLREIRAAESLAERKAAKKGAAVEAPAKGPRKAKLLVAKSFPEWQEKVLAALRAEYDESSNSFKKEIKDILIGAGLMKEKLAFPFAMETKVGFHENATCLCRLVTDLPCLRCKVENGSPGGRCLGPNTQVRRKEDGRGQHGVHLQAAQLD